MTAPYFPTRNPILRQSMEILASAGFAVALKPAAPPVDEMVLAENPESILGIAVFHDESALVEVASAGANELSRLLIDSGAKRWDAYLLLLSPLPAEDRGMDSQVADVIYNTSYLRRVVRWDVAADEPSVSAALRSFLPLPGGASMQFRAPLTELFERLPLHGVSRTELEDLRAAWQRSGLSNEGVHGKELSDG